MTFGTAAARAIVASARLGPPDERTRAFVRTVSTTPSVDILADRVRYHRCSGLMLKTFDQDLEPDHPLREHLTRDRNTGVVRTLRARADLPGLVSAVSSQTDRWALIKGPAVGDFYYAGADERPYDDLDLLIPRSGVRETVDALLGAGARLLDRDWRTLIEERRSQLHLKLEYGTLLDLHWDLLNRGAVRDDFAVEVPVLLERTRVRQIGGHPVRVLEPEDALIHLAIHTAVSGGHRVGWFADVDRLVRAEELDDDVLVARSRAARARAAVGAVLRTARDELSTPVQDRTLHSLIGAIPSAELRLVSATQPLGTASSERTLRTAWFQTLRDVGHGWSPRVARWTSPRALASRVRGSAGPGATSDHRETLDDFLASLADER